MHTVVVQLYFVCGVWYTLLLCSHCTYVLLYIRMYYCILQLLELCVLQFCVRECPSLSDTDIQLHVVNGHCFVVKTAVSTEPHFNVLHGRPIQDHPEPGHVRILAASTSTDPLTAPEGTGVEDFPSITTSLRCLTVIVASNECRWCLPRTRQGAWAVSSA